MADSALPVFLGCGPYKHVELPGGQVLVLDKQGNSKMKMDRESYMKLVALYPEKYS